MKSVFIVHNQVMRQEVRELLDELELRGFTRFDDLKGRGSTDGNPHMGTHTWPALNGAILCIVEDHQVDPLLEGIKQLDTGPVDRGIRAFVWTVEEAV